MNNIHRILFICHGNICRSPLAEFTLKALVQALDLQQAFSIASAATSQEELGNPVYPPVRKILDELNIDYSHKRARQVTAEDVRDFDYLIAMEQYNLDNLSRLHLPIREGQLHLLRDFTPHKGDIADPWYTRDFEKAYAQILEGCVGLLRHFLAQGTLTFSASRLEDSAAKLRTKSHN